MVSQKPCVEMHPRDDELLKIEKEEVVQVSALEGRSLNMKVKYFSKPISGVITAPYPCILIDEGGIIPVKVNRLKGN